MVQLLLDPDDDTLSKPGVVRFVYDPAAGTGGMLSVADEYLRRANPHIQLSLFGQDYNDASYAICKADMVIEGQDVDNIRLGDTLTEDYFGISTYVWILSNRKTAARKGLVQLVDAREFFSKLRKGLGSKRYELSTHDIERIVSLYATFEGNENSKTFRNEDFLYRTITVA